MYNRLILVAGSGQRGTSLFAGILSALGCHVPQPEVGAEGAPKGFGEPQWVVNWHSKLLRKVAVQPTDARPSAWALTAGAGREQPAQTNLENWLHGEFKKGDHVIIKDPRLAWFIPAWRRAGETVAAPNFITVLRHPLEVITSNELGYVERWNPNARTAGWINTMLYTERATRGDRRSIVRQEDLAGDAMLAVSRVAEELDLDVVNRATPPQMRVATNLVEPGSDRSRPQWTSLEVDHRLVELAEEVHKLLDGAAAQTRLDDQSVKADLDALRQRYLDLYRFVESTAQFSIAALGGADARRAGPAATTPSVLSPDSVRKMVRRAKRRSKRTIHQLRSRGGAPTAGGGSSSAREGE